MRPLSLPSSAARKSASQLDPRPDAKTPMTLKCLPAPWETLDAIRGVKRPTSSRQRHSRARWKAVDNRVCLAPREENGAAFRSGEHANPPGSKSREYLSAGVMERVLLPH